MLSFAAEAAGECEGLDSLTGWPLALVIVVAIAAAAWLMGRML